MRKLGFVAALLAGTLFTGTANASVVITGITDNPGYLTGDLSYAPTSLALGGVGISRFNLTGTNQPGNTPVSYFTYCIDIFNSLHTGTFDISPLSTLVSNATKQAQLLALLGNTNPLLAAATTQADKMKISAATQMAVWEIAFESGTNTAYSLSAGDLRVTGGNSADARLLAGTYLSNVVSGTWGAVAGTQVQLLYSRDNQSQIFLTAGPEPATWAMMIGGFGLVGATMRRRQRTTITYA